MKKQKTLISDHGIEEKQDKLGIIVIATCSVVDAVMVILGLLAFINP